MITKQLIYLIYSLPIHPHYIIINQHSLIPIDAVNHPQYHYIIDGVQTISSHGSSSWDCVSVSPNLLATIEIFVVLPTNNPLLWPIMSQLTY